MAVLSVQEEFQSGDNVTATNLNNLVKDAYFNADTTDNSTLEVHTTGYLKIKDLGVDTQHLAADAVTNAKIADNAVDTAQIAADAVTYAKMQDVSATDRVLGRDSAGAGEVEEITPANLRTMINVADGAEVNVQSDWNATSGDAFILNKPTIPTVPTNVSAFTNDSGYTTNTGTVTEVDAGTGLVTNPVNGIVGTGTIGIADGGVDTDQLADNAVTSAKIAANAVTSTEISSTDNTFKVASTEVVVNDGGADVDFRVEGDTNANLLVCDAGNDTVHIGGTPTNTTASKFAVVANSSDLVACFENLAANDSGSQVLIRGGTAALYLHDDQNATPNVNNYGIVVSGGVLRINLINDAGTASTPLMELNSSGNLRIAGTLTQNATF